MRSAEFEDLSNVGKVRDVTAHLILPTCTIVLGTIPIIARHTRSAVLDIMNAPFIRAAQCHGLLPRTILFKYLLRASVSPLISLLGISIGALLSGSILVEVITGWPGIGPLLLEAILARDLNIVLGAIILSTLFLLTGNLITDVLLYASDPRIRGAQS
jgi:peptide/nickel transport system permease protein